VTPRIAIAPCSKLPDYVEAVRRAGGDPWVLDPAIDRPEDVAARAAGLLLAGGGDVRPALYGAVPHPTFDPAESGRDEYELELARRADATDLPLLAICRGIQLLNVARGGTLIQDIPAERPSAIQHRLPVPPHAATELAHQVRVAPGTRLAAALGGSVRENACEVNSRHHQAVDALGRDLVVSATAPDGVIEAVEDPRRRFLIAVQWHPENFWRSGEFASLFTAFVNA
jgi:gamma-glutamyl-gamma-aminobutyrate hydrolase PuuD